MLVELEILEDEVEAAGPGPVGFAGLEADRVVLHLGHPGGVLGAGLGQEEGLDSPGPRCSRDDGPAS